MSAPSDIDKLIARAALQDRAAFRELYGRTSAKLFGVCLRILRDRAEAEEALQEVYVKIWIRASTFAVSETSPMSWLIAVARNHAIDLIRARRPETVDIEEAVDLADEGKTPEGEAINASEGRRISACLEELDGRHAEAVRGAYVEGFSYQELADRFEIPVNTMRTWLRRSLAKLKECLER